MSVFKTKSWLYLRNPRGGVEDLDRMQAAGFEGVFCNIGDHTPDEWQTIRGRAGARGMFCGPWARTATAGNAWSPYILDRIIDCAEVWESPLIVNCESEIQGTGTEATGLIAESCAGLDAAIAPEPIPFDNVGWWPCKEMPTLPQIRAENVPSLDWIIEQWHAYGIDCVFPTYSSWGGDTPGDFPLNAPYGVYTGDDMGGNYAAWSPREHSYQGCVEQNGGDDMEVIGSQDGVTASMNRLRDMDPGGTLLKKDASGKWPKESIDTLTQPLDQWKAYDKLERSLTILVEDHDADVALVQNSAMGEEAPGGQE